LDRFAVDDQNFEIEDDLGDPFSYGNLSYYVFEDDQEMYEQMLSNSHSVQSTHVLSDVQEEETPGWLKPRGETLDNYLDRVLAMSSEDRSLPWVRVPGFLTTPDIEVNMPNDLAYLSSDGTHIVMTGSGQYVITSVRSKINGSLAVVFTVGDYNYLWHEKNVQKVAIPYGKYEIVGTNLYPIDGNPKQEKFLFGNREYTVCLHPWTTLDEFIPLETVATDGVIVMINARQYKVKDAWTCDLQVTKVSSDFIVAHDLKLSTPSFPVKELDIVEVSCPQHVVLRVREDKTVGQRVHSHYNVLLTSGELLNSVFVYPRQADVKLYTPLALGLKFRSQLTSSEVLLLKKSGLLYYDPVLEKSNVGVAFFTLSELSAYLKKRHRDGKRTTYDVFISMLQSQNLTFYVPRAHELLDVLGYTVVGRYIHFYRDKELTDLDLRDYFCTKRVEDSVRKYLTLKERWRSHIAFMLRRGQAISEIIPIILKVYGLMIRDIKSEIDLQLARLKELQNIK